MGKTFKKILCTLLVVVMCLTSAPLQGFAGIELTNLSEWFSEKASADASDEFGYYQGYSYTLKKDNTIRVYGYKGDIQDGKLVIPSKMWGKTVTEVSFSYTLDSKIKSIILPNTVIDISITEPKVEYISIPNSVKTISKLMINVKNIELPDSINEIGDSAFWGYEALESIKLPKGVKEIGDYTFYECKNLKSINLESVKSIGNSAFIRCKSLKEITISSDCSMIGSYAFAECERLKKVTFLGDVDLISEYAFMSCMRLDTVDFKGALTNIGAGAFGVCLALSEIIIPKSVKKIDEYAFSSCYSLKNIDIYSKTAQISKTAFDKDTYTIDVEKYCELNEKIYEIYNEVSEVTLEHFGDKYDSTPVEEIVKYQEKLLKEKGEPKLRKQLNKTLVKDKESKLLILCYKGSTAEKYAKENGIKYKYFSNNPDEVTAFKANTTTSSAITLSWDKVSNATGYVVYKYDSAKKKYVKLGSTKKTTYKVSELKKGTTYKFKIKSYKKVNDKTYYSDTVALTTATKPGTPTLKVTAGTKSAKLTWNKQTGATGYVVYMATSKDGKYSKIATVKGNSKVTYTKKSLKSGQTYYFKVRAYKTVDKLNIYSSYSGVKSVKL